jgi:hypothetical protein
VYHLDCVLDCVLKIDGYLKLPIVVFILWLYLMKYSFEVNLVFCYGIRASVLWVTPSREDQICVRVDCLFLFLFVCL